jgi:hypothetical protein
MRIAIASLGLAGLLIPAAATAQITAEASPAPATRQAEPLPGTYPRPSYERALKARAHLEALLAGRLSTADLSPQELQDVLDLDRIARGATGDSRSTRQKCVDEEVRRNGGTPSRLAWEVIRMKCR